MAEASLNKTILILSANPKGTAPLRLDQEVRQIKAGLQRSKYRDRFRVEQAEAVSAIDLQRAMLDFNPQIVHFCGHGEKEGIILENESGDSAFVDAEALADTFSFFEQQVECVLLNACYSTVQAEAIVRHIDSVIGMSQAVGDRAAIDYAVSFYDALGAGRDLDFAHRWGCNALKLKKRRKKADGLSAADIPVLHRKPEIEDAEVGNASAAPRTARIFISYKRNSDPDEAVALDVLNALDQHHEVFIDQSMLVGTPWAERIETEIRRSDVLIVLLSEQSAQSEMVEREVRLADKLAKEQAGRPMILPVRLDYREPFHYPLNQYLDPINWAFWTGHEDTPRLIEELQQAIAGGELSVAGEAAKKALLYTSPPDPIPRPSASAQPVALEMPEGTMNPESEFYVERPSDQVALSTIQQKGVTITIKGPRQMGKSSLLIRTIQVAQAVDKEVVFLDFQLFDKDALTDAEQFFRQFCTWLTDELDLEDKVEEYWQRPVSNSQRCTRYVGRHLLKTLGKPLVLAMDEVESIFDCDFRTDFFSMLRSWHNQRATNPAWKNLDLTLVTSTEPYQLIADLNQSPFNVGQVLDLTDFTTEQVSHLNQLHDHPFSVGELRSLMTLLNGHPYLVRRALYLVASERMTVNALFSQAAQDRGPFGDHLRYHLFRMYDKTELVQGLLQVIQNQSCPDERIFFRLRGAGLVRRQEQSVIMRCPLYAQYFKEHLR